MVILAVFPRFEQRIDKFQEQRSYEFISAIKLNKPHQLEALLREYKLQLRSQKRVSEATS